MVPVQPRRASLLQWYRSISSSLVLPLALAVACGCSGSTDAGDAAAAVVSCAMQNGATQGGTNACDLTWSSCSDGLTYQIQCAPSAGGFTCSCYRSAVLTGTFVTCAVCANTNGSDNSAVNTGCGWNLRSTPGAPPQCSSVGPRDAGVDVPGSCRGRGASCTGTCCPGLTCVGFTGFRPGTCG
jgi:hypothetical protein